MCSHKVNTAQQSCRAQQASSSGLLSDTVARGSLVLSKVIAQKLRPHSEGEFVEESLVATADLLALGKGKLCIVCKHCTLNDCRKKTLLRHLPVSLQTFRNSGQRKVYRRNWTYFFVSLAFWPYYTEIVKQRQEWEEVNAPAGQGGIPAAPKPFSCRVALNVFVKAFIVEPVDVAEHLQHKTIELQSNDKLKGRNNNFLLPELYKLYRGISYSVDTCTDVHVCKGQTYFLFLFTTDSCQDFNST